MGAGGGRNLSFGDRRSKEGERMAVGPSPRDDVCGEGWLLRSLSKQRAERAQDRRLL